MRRRLIFAKLITVVLHVEIWGCKKVAYRHSGSVSEKAELFDPDPPNSISWLFLTPLQLHLEMRHATVRWWGFGPAVPSWDYHCFDVMVIGKLFQLLEGGHQGGVTPVWAFMLSVHLRVGTHFNTWNVTLSGCFYEIKGIEFCVVWCGGGEDCILVLIDVTIGVWIQSTGPGGGGMLLKLGFHSVSCVLD